MPGMLQGLFVQRVTFFQKYCTHEMGTRSIFEISNAYLPVGKHTTWNLMNIDIVKKKAYANKECWSLSSMLLGVVWQWQVDSLAEVGEKNIVLNTLWFPVRFCKHLQTFASRPWSQESKPTDSRFKMQDSRCRKTFWIQERLSRPWIEPWILNPTLLSFANACKRVFWNFPWVLSQDS